MANKVETVNWVRPTLFIGLGGTGKEVLLRLRRKFYERFGEPSLPCAAFLCLDTDMRDVMAQGEMMDEFYRSVSFTEAEYISLLGGSIRESMISIFRNESHWQHVHKWLHEELERYGFEIDRNFLFAANRAVGRLLFFCHYTTIRERVSQALHRLATHEAVGPSRRFLGDVEWLPEPNVCLIFSVAGGTGGGIFLDLAFLLRKLQREGMPINRTDAMAFLPNVYYPTAHGEMAQRTHANAYAALKELEFFTLRRIESGPEALGIDFEVEWERGRPERIQGPPFSVTYLLERQNENGIGIEVNARSELFEMAAQSLFLDFLPGPFSTEKRARLAGIVAAYLSNPVGPNVSSDGLVLSPPFACRYASFGLSKIAIPVDAIKRACAAQLAFDIISHWKRDYHHLRNKEYLLDRIARHRLDPDGILARFRTDWKESLERDIEKLFTEISLNTPSDCSELATRLAEIEDRIIGETGGDPTRWGVVSTEIRSRAMSVVEQVRRDVLTLLTQHQGSSNDSLQVMLSQMEVLRELLLDSKFETRREALDRDVRYWLEERVNSLAELEKVLGRSAWAQLGLKKRKARNLSNRLKDAGLRYLLTKAYILVLEEARRVTAECVKLIEEIQKDLQHFADTVEEARHSFSSLCDVALSFQDDALFQYVFDRDRDWLLFYRLNENPVDAQVESRRFLESRFGPSATLWEFIQKVLRKGDHSLREDLLNYCNERFRQDFESHPRQPDVLQHPQVRGRLDEIASYLVRSALPWLRREEKLAGDTLPILKLAFLGIAEERREPYRRFIERTILQVRGYGYGYVSVLSTGDPTAVYLYTACFAFPLASIPLVTQKCHHAYYDFYKMQRAGQVGDRALHVPLHLSKEWEGVFDDLIVYSEQEAKAVKEALEVLLFGSILRVIEVKEVNGRLEYGYKKWIPPASRLEILGTRREAIEILRGDSMFRGSLLKTVKEREDGLKDQLESYYWLLFYLSLSEEFPPKTPERIFLEDTLFRIHDRLAKDKDKAELSLEHLPQEKQVEEAKARLGDNAEWIGTFPVLKGLEAWVSRD
jgi:hypothetical protein